VSTTNAAHSQWRIYSHGRTSQCTSPEDGQTSCIVWLTVERRRFTNQGEMSKANFHVRLSNSKQLLRNIDRSQWC